LEAIVDEIWRRIEHWLSRNARPVSKSLRPGASGGDIAAAEKALGRPLPDDFLASLSRHDGQQPDPNRGGSPGFVYGLYLFPITRAVQRHQVLDRLLEQGVGRNAKVLTDGPVRAVWWDRAWLPVADDGMSNFQCLDLHPAPRGRVGQVIQCRAQNPWRSVEAKSFRAWLSDFADGLTSGGYVYSREHDGLITRDDAIAAGVIPRPH
jgi:cell wall assembly regulator SMI1